MPFEQQPIQNFIGTGLTFPIKLINGRGVLVTGFDLIKSSLYMILSWPFGNRYFLGEFGSRLEDLLEEPNDEVLKDLLETFIIDAITQWEKRVEVMSVDITNSSPTSLNVNLTYRIINSQLVDNFVFPFYRQIIY